MLSIQLISIPRRKTTIRFANSQLVMYDAPVIAEVSWLYGVRLRLYGEVAGYVTHTP